MKRLRSILLVLLVSGCLDRLEVPVIISEPRLVVDGMVTNTPGPHTVKLFWHSDLNQNLKNPEPVPGATVSIADDAGNVETLVEEDPGIYKTNVLEGVLGREYQLRVTTSEGVIYESVPAVLQPAGEITNLYYEYRKNEINAHDPLLPQDALAIYVDGRGQEGFSNLLRWRWSGTFHITTFPELRMRAENRASGFEMVPDPELCSGYIYTGGQLVMVAPCTCCDCWVTQKGSEVKISDNRIVSNLEFKRVLLTKIPIDKWLFDDKYYFEADQLSVQQEAYNFWKLVAVQQETAENIFQPNVVAIKGNIRCITDVEKKAYGIFSVSAITRKSFYIDRTALPALPWHEMGTKDCRLFFENSSNVKPFFW